MTDRLARWMTQELIRPDYEMDDVLSEEIEPHKADEWTARGYDKAARIDRVSGGGGDRVDDV